ncbi:Rap1a/Tai family immunity protein [uncultured Massilia sp.]|uniref:Rap1a/Tai family immunity protein n=1 Tax=uncultured Massilia sp. TaxID=169973 RepID=UPI002587B306|nr:Rap1a/Tai family immunity protein [uncultured Massilia sp.]
MRNGRQERHSSNESNYPLRVGRWQAILFFALIASAVPATAQPVSERPWMTGQQFVELSAWPDNAHSNIDLTPLQAMNQELARMFLVGVHDATEGKAWCFGLRAKPKPDTLKDQAISGLRAMNQQQLRRSAAELVVEIWRSKYPCAKIGSAP